MRRIHWLSWGVLIALVAIAVVHTKTFDSELADHPDEAAHFVTGVMVFDYLRGSLGSPPVPFAIDYYAHYPRIGIGHWPPFFYVMESAAFAIAGPTIQTAMMLVVLCLLATILLLYEQLRRTYDGFTALWCAALPLALPVVRRTSTLLLPDVAVGLLSLLAVFAFAKYLRTDRLRDILWFSLWASLAILTKGNGIALGLFAVLAILFTRQFRVLWSWRLWFGGALVSLATLSHFVLWNLATNTGGGGHLSHGYMLHNLETISWQVPRVMGVAALVMAAIGAGWALCRGEEGGQTDKTHLARTAAVYVAAVIIFHVVCPVTGEQRYLVTAVPAAFILIADLSDRMNKFGMRWSLLWAAAMSLAVFVPPAVSRHGPNYSSRATGYRAAVRNISNSGGPTVILVSGTSSVEGAILAARRLQDPDLNDYVLRASKVLATDSWSGKNYKLAVDQSQLKELLQSLPVHFVVLDDFEYPGQHVGAHHELLRKAIARNPDLFAKVGAFPVHALGHTTPDALKVYEVTATRGRAPSAELKKLLSNLGRSVSGYSQKPSASR